MNKKRYYLLDSVRGMAMISMILYHATWDIVNLFGVEWQWYQSDMAGLWQKSICCTFIFLSGFCWNFGSKRLFRGLELLICSTIITVVTLLFMPDSRIVFGVLNLIGFGMLLMIPLDRCYRKIPPFIGAMLSFLLLIFTWDINNGELGFLSVFSFELPEEWYTNYFSTFLGFPYNGFISMDYFSIFPWIFLYQAGYFVYRISKKNNLLERLPEVRIKPLEWIGRNSLIVYMLHQPVVYICLFVFFKLS